MKHSKKVVVVGSAGRLGVSLVEALRRDHTVIPLTRGDLDLASPESIEKALGPLDYDSLVIAGALTGVDYCESNEQEAFAVNATGPGRISEISAGKGAHVSYLSTDFVYDGTKRSAYTESDPANPISVYGASKLLGEANVLGSSPKNLVLRVSWLFGRGKSAFPEWIIQKCMAESGVTLPMDKWGCPTSCDDLVDALLQLAGGASGEEAAGVCNFCNPEPCSWRDWGQFCIDTAKRAGLPIRCEFIRGIPMAEVAAFVAKRPSNSALCIQRFMKLTGKEPPSWQEAVGKHLHQSDLFKGYTSTRTTNV